MDKNHSVSLNVSYSIIINCSSYLIEYLPSYKMPKIKIIDPKKVCILWRTDILYEKSFRKSRKFLKYSKTWL
jgi:hypothetical protein